MKKRKKIIISLIVIFVIIIIGLIGYFLSRTREKTSVNDFSSVKELIEFDGHEYIKEEKSEEEGYEDDIYLKFSKPPINDDGTTNKSLYEIVISHVAGFRKGHNFRMVDTENNVLVKIQYNENDEVSLYTINNDGKYWEHIKSNYQIDNYQNEPLTSFTITSPLLANVINANWIYNNVSLGEKDSTADNYEIYWDEGYKVRKIGSEIYNIVFTQNYKDEIVNGITSTTSIENVENILGNPTYEDTNNDIIGYKCEYFYIFFSNGEVSIYHPDEYDEEDSRKFGELVTELNSTGDMNTFLNKLTDLYPNYANYTSYNNNKFIQISYPLLGLEVTMGAIRENGIRIYKNFQGNITEDVKIDDLRENKNLPGNTYTDLDENLVFLDEKQRWTNDDLARNPDQEAFWVQTGEYTLQKIDNKYIFYSRDKTKIDSELNIQNMTNILAYNDTVFIYGVSDDGIYEYNAENQESRKLVEGNNEFNLEKIEGNTIYFDDTSVTF